MSAAATDLLMEVGTPGTATTLSAPGYTIGDVAITVGSTANWPTATGVAFAIDTAEIVNGVEVRVDGSYCEFVGTVASATSVTNVSKVYGTAQNYSAGALTRVYIPVHSERENRIVEWGLGHADQDGTLKAGAVDNAAVLASDVVNGSKIADDSIDSEHYVDGSIDPQHLMAGTGSSWAWQTWAPTPAGMTIGNGTVAGRYVQTGKTADFRVVITCGTTSALAGGGVDTTITLPVTMSSTTYGINHPIGSWTWLDASTNDIYGGFLVYNTATTARLLLDRVTGANVLRKAFNSDNAAVVFATGDVISITGSVEAA